MLRFGEGIPQPGLGECRQHILMVEPTRDHQRQTFPAGLVDDGQNAELAPIMGAQGLYSDNRIMKRANGEMFWCHVMGRAFNRDDPHEGGVWSFEDLSALRPVRAELTAREREVAARLLEGMTSKEIGRCLDISHRTVEIYRTRLMRKYGAESSSALVQKLLAGGSSLDIVLGPDEV